MAKKGQASSGGINIFTPGLPNYANYVRTSGKNKTGSGKICVVGRAVLGDEQLQSVWAAISQSADGLPDMLEPDAPMCHHGQVLNDGYFAFTGDQEVPGAKCNGAGTQVNYLKVWAKFPSATISLNPARPFLGECNSEYCECDRPSTAVSKVARKKGATKGAKKKVAKAAKKTVKKTSKRA